MAPRYPGDSPGKKLARYFVWLLLEKRAWDRADRAATGHHLVLCSREAGDVSLLLGAGTPPRNIWAADIDPGAISAASARFPDVRYFLGDVFQFRVPKPKKRPRPRLTTLFLDMCCQMSEDVAEGAAGLCAANAKDQFALVIGYMRGREQDSAVKRELTERAELREAAAAGCWESAFEASLRAAADSLAALRPGSSREAVMDEALHTHYDEVRDEAEQLAGAGPARADTSIARVTVLDAMLASVCMARGVEIQPIGMVDYHSRSRSSRGVPMTMAVYKGWRLHGRRPGEREYMARSARYAAECEDSYVVATDAEVRDAALAVSDKHSCEKAALVMNVGERQVAAWRACRTMGRYDRFWIRENGLWRTRKDIPSNIPGRGPEARGRGPEAEGGPAEAGGRGRSVPKRVY